MRTEESNPPIHVPPRELYPPASISEAARAVLAVDPMLDVETTMPDPTDLVAWKAISDLVDRGLAEQLGTMIVEGSFDRRAVAGVSVHTAIPAASIPDDGRIFLDIHGGAFVFGSGDACAAFTRQTMVRVGMTTLGIDYRMPPAFPYPAPLDDCVAVYRALLDDHPPESLVVGGTSAGGNLAAALILRAKDEGLPMPSGLVLLSPEVDLTESGDSFQTLLGVDSVLRNSLADTIRAYAGDADLRHPYLSPLFGDLRNFPPTLIQSGTRDLFLSNAVRLHRELRACGVRAELHVFEAMPHGGFNLASPTPEDLDLANEVRSFLGSL